MKVCEEHTLSCALGSFWTQAYRELLKEDTYRDVNCVNPEKRLAGRLAKPLLTVKSLL